MMPVLSAPLPTRAQPTAACGLVRLAILLSLAVLAGCSKTKPTSQSNPPSATFASQSIEKSTEKGPVKLTVRADRSQSTVGERIAFTITVLADPAVEVHMPDVNKTLGEFEVVDAQSPPDIPEGSNRVWEHRYGLRTLEAGELEIPSVTVKFKDRRNAAANATVEENEIASEPLKINVHSLITGQFDPEKYRDIKDAVDVPLPWNLRSLLWIAGGIALISAAIIALILLKRRRAEVVVAPPLPPHEWALRELDALREEQLIERGEFHEFYFRLSAILRQYIERRFNIMAAEQTTEEFLRAARNHDALSEGHRVLLTQFLRQADMVKFAKFQPTQHESEAAFEAASHFVEETAPHASELAASQMNGHASLNGQMARSPHSHPREPVA